MMMKPKEYYRDIGLSVGLEVHWELDTDYKLFCNCPTVLRIDEPEVVVERFQRAVPGETGEVDVAAQFETIKGRKILYQAYSDSTCEIEMDSAPPLSPNSEAIKTALTVSLLLEAKPVDEIHVMRKTIIDGSLPSGFQRTMLIAHDGCIEMDSQRIRMEEICLEEDAARKMEEGKGYVIFRLDRLGIPEIEVGTAPDIHSPDQARQVASEIGKIIKSTGKAKTGLGVVRQDINVSIKGGNRVEIKHLQRLGMIPTVIEREVERQSSLIEIKRELRRRGLKKTELVQKVLDVSHLFTDTRSKIIRGGKVYAIRLPKLSGLLKQKIQGEKSFGKEIAEIVQVKTGLGGLIHSDELPAYGISQEELDKLRGYLEASQRDCLVLLLGEEEKARIGFHEVVERVMDALDAVPSEVRAPLEDGTSRFIRPLPGAARMYPETDCIPVSVTKELISEIKSDLPDHPRVVEARLLEKYRLSKDLVSQLLDSDYFSIFERVVEEVGVSPTLVASTLTYTLSSLRREGIPIENISRSHIQKIFSALKQGRIAKEALPEVLGKISVNPDMTEEIIGERGISRAHVEKIVSQIVSDNENLIEERREMAIKALMGIVMKRLRGKYDGKAIHEMVKRAVEERL